MPLTPLMLQLRQAIFAELKPIHHPQAPNMRTHMMVAVRQSCWLWNELSHSQVAPWRGAIVEEGSTAAAAKGHMGLHNKITSKMGALQAKIRK